MTKKKRTDYGPLVKALYRSRCGSEQLRTFLRPDLLGLFPAFARSGKREKFRLILRLLAIIAVAISPMIVRQIDYQTKVIAVQVLILNSYDSFTQFGKCAAWAYQISYSGPCFTSISLGELHNVLVDFKLRRNWEPENRPPGLNEVRT